MKEIVLPVCEMKEALQGLNKIVGRSRALPVLQSVRVARDAEGKLSIEATDLDSCATYHFKKAQSGAPAQLLVPLDQLSKTVKGLSSDGIIGLTAESKDKLELRYSIAGNVVEQNITTLPVDEFPPTPKVHKPGTALEPGFGTALKQALECCSEDTSRRTINGAALDVRDKKFHYIIGTNGRMLFAANSYCFDLEKTVIVPDSKFLEWTDLMDEQPCSLSFEPGEEEQPAKNGKPGKEATAGWVKFQSPKWTFITKEIEGQFPNWKQVLPDVTSKWTKVVLSEDAVKQVLQVVPKLPGDYSPNFPIRLRVDSHLILEGQNKDQDTWTSIPITAVNVTGNPVVVALNREYFTRAVRFGLNQLDIENELSPVVFSSGRKKMVIMPVRLDTGTPPAAAPAQSTSAPDQTPVEQTTSPNPSATQPEERTTMPRTAKSTLPVAPRAEGHNRLAEPTTSTGNGNGNGSAVTSLVEHVEQIKETLKNVIRDLAHVIDIVKTADKEKRTTEKEIEAIRTKLRQIQNVTI